VRREYMDNNIIKPEPWFKRWYSFNFQKIPAIFITIGTIFFTAFIDFNIQGTDIVLQSHIAAIRKFLNTDLGNLSAFLLFLIYLVSILQMFNSIGYSKKRSPMSLFMLTGLTLLQVVSVGLYTYTFFREQTIRNDYVIDSVARFSYSVFIIGAVLFIIGTVFAWFYVDWKYVKQKEE
jgi:TRAP-type mannitol/chloroaromatic compound transport system permease small subunit